MIKGEVLNYIGSKSLEEVLDRIEGGDFQVTDINVYDLGITHDDPDAASLSLKIELRSIRPLAVSTDGDSNGSS